MPQPADGLFVNPDRISNPFLLLDTEVDWGLPSRSVAPQTDLKNTLSEQSNQPPKLPIGTIKRGSGAPSTEHSTWIRPSTQSSGSNPTSSQSQEAASPPFVTSADRHQIAEDNTEDLLGGGVEEEVNWKPLLR